MKEKIVKFTSVAFLVGFFIVITVVGLKDCDEPIIHLVEPEQSVLVEPEQFVLVEDIIFEVFMGENYEGNIPTD